MKKYLSLLSLAATLSAFAESSLIKSIEISTPLNAPDDGTFWMQARAAVLPEYQPPGKDLSTPVVITLQKTDRVGTHMYHGLRRCGRTRWEKAGPTPSRCRKWIASSTRTA
jgi:hypothetical protein